MFHCSITRICGSPGVVSEVMCGNIVSTGAPAGKSNRCPSGT